MILYLVRHAEAKKEEDDQERPLSDEGWTDIRKVTSHAAAHLEIKVGRVLHSGKTRARQTAEALSEAIRPAPRVESADDLDPMADPQVWARRLSKNREDLMLVGHIPHLAKLAALLISGNEDNPSVTFQTATVLCLERGAEDHWSVQWMVIPSTV